MSVKLAKRLQVIERPVTARVTKQVALIDVMKMREEDW